MNTNIQFHIFIHSPRIKKTSQRTVIFTHSVVRMQTNINISERKSQALSGLL